VSACAAIAAIILNVRSAYHLWIAALALLGLSLGLGVRALLLQGAEEIGPLLADMLDDRATYDDETIEEALLKDLSTETLANEQALARKDPLLAGAVTLLVIAILLEFAGVQ
jgi:hypothetical protein